MALHDRLLCYLQRIRQVCPDVEASTIRLIADEGQNNDVLVVNECVIFRFPRYQGGVDRLERVAHILRSVRRHVALPVPDPLYVSFEPPELGQAFLGYPMLSGVPLWRETLETMTETALHGLATQLAGFLQELHRVPVEEVFPARPIDFHPLAHWEDLYARIRRKLFPIMRPDASQSVAEQFRAFLSDPDNLCIAPALVHGDFGTGNVLYSPEEVQITGIIDFDAADVGDPAVDLAAALSGPSAFTDRLLQVYPVGEGTMKRVKSYKGTFALQEALFGIETGDQAAFRSGIGPYL